MHTEVNRGRLACDPPCTERIRDAPDLVQTSENGIGTLVVGTDDNMNQSQKVIRHGSCCIVRKTGCGYLRDSVGMRGIVEA